MQVQSQSEQGVVCFPFKEFSDLMSFISLYFVLYIFTNYVYLFRFRPLLMPFYLALYSKIFSLLNMFYYVPIIHDHTHARTHTYTHTHILYCPVLTIYNLFPSWCIWCFTKCSSLSLANVYSICLPQTLASEAVEYIKQLSCLQETNYFDII